MRFSPLIISLAFCGFAAPACASDLCTFTDWDWNTRTGQAQNIRSVEIPRADLTAAQKHPSLPCTVCREDQVEVYAGAAKTLVCAAVADDIQSALDDAGRGGFEIDKLVGYRVGKTKGVVDENGYRTQYSHHSFGVAIDINPDKNGLYDRCTAFSKACRLRRGGIWKPGTPGAITPRTPIYGYMREAGFKWGGELRGRQKDFMHFSLTGD